MIRDACRTRRSARAPLLSRFVVATVLGVVAFAPRSAGAQPPASSDAGVPPGDAGAASRSDAAVAPEHDASRGHDGDAGPEAAPHEDAPDEHVPDEDASHEDAEPGPAEGSDDDDDLFPEDGDLSALLEGEGDLEIPDVVVTATAEPELAAAPTGGAVQRLDADLLERFNYDNPDAIIQQVPGAYVRQEDGYGLRPNIGLRGVSSDRSSRVTLMEDGVLFGPAPYAAPAAYYFPLMTRMTGVDVTMGAASIPYGPMTVGGAIDMHNREIPREADGGIDLALGTNWFGRLHAHYGASNDWGGILVEGVYLRSDGFKHLASPEVGDDTGFDRGEVLLRGELHGALTDDAYQRLELRFGVSGESSNETYLGLTDEDFRADPYQRYDSSRLDQMEWWRTQVQLRHTLEIGDGFRLRTIGYRHDIERSWNKVNAMGGLPNPGGSQVRLSLFDILTNPTGTNQVLVGVLRGDQDGEALPTSNDYVLIGTNARGFGVTGLQSDGVGQAVTGPLRHQVRAGVRIHHDDVDRLHTEDAYAMIGGNLMRATEETYTLLDSHAEALAFSAYAAYSLTLFDAVTLTPGVRTELIWTSYRDEAIGETADFRAAIIPGGGLEWRIVEEVAVFAGVMRGFAPVSPGQAANVQPEDSISYEAGARVTHAGTRLDAQVTGFINDYSNYLQQCSFSSGCADDAVDDQSNGGRPIVGGVDVRIGASPRFEGVTIPLRASYTFTYSELRDAIDSSPSPLFVGGVPGDHLPYMPEHQVSVQAGVELREFGLNVSGSFVSEMWEAVGQGDDAVPRTDAMFLLDASLYLQLFEQLRLYVRGENLTNTQSIASRRPFGARPNRPLSIQVGVRVEL